MFVSLHSLTLLGLDAYPIEVEVDQRNGQANFVLVGLGDTAVQEAKARVRPALKNSGLRIPRRVVTVNLSPADIRKEGSRFDLAMALGLAMMGEEVPVPPELDTMIFLGELALDGTLKPVTGMLPLVLGAKELGYLKVFVPEENVKEVAFIEEIEIYGCKALREVAEYFLGNVILDPAPKTPLDQLLTESSAVDFSEIKGQEHAKRALEISAAGGHNVLMSGPPGSGKTLLAKAFSSILPPMTPQEMIETTKIYSVSGLVSRQEPFVFRRPFRAPHHTASHVSLVGGGRIPKPGEISLAHHGVLYLDEMTEFPSKVLEVLRQPLEDRKITIARVQGTLEYPASFILLASYNPCPCGYVTDPERECQCSAVQVMRYQQRLSGPLLDRIDLNLEVPRLDYQKIASKERGEQSSIAKQRVMDARAIQATRNANAGLNAHLTLAEIREFCGLQSDAEALLKKAMNSLQLSGRAYHRILKVSRTIADLSNSRSIETSHLSEALQYRRREG